MKIFNPKRKFQTYRWLGFWKKVPPSFRVKVQESEGIIEKNLGFTGRVKRAAFAQLYSDRSPVSLVDLDSQKDAKLTFRIYYPPEPEQLYDAWSLVIQNSRGQVVSETRRYGTLPEYVDWREVSEGVLRRDIYYYQVNLFKDSEEYPGIPNRVETIEGLSLLRSDYSKTVEMEPRAEIGYFALSHTSPTEPSRVSGLFVNADVAFSFWNRLLFRGAALSALERVDPRANFTFTRLGIGYRLYGQGENAILGSPHLVRADLLATLSAFGIPSNAAVPRFIDWGVLFESHIVLWAYNYLVPWFEYGVRPERGIRRLSLGVGYYFFVRPWSMKLGFGVASDRILRYQPPGNDEPLADKTFEALRTYTSMIFFL